MKYFHAEKDGNCGQGIVGVGGLVYTTVSLYVEGLGGDGIDMCNLEVIFQKWEICWTTTMEHHE